jgi:hypothetical protein
MIAGSPVTAKSGVRASPVALAALLIALLTASVVLCQASIIWSCIPGKSTPVEQSEAVSQGSTLLAACAAASAAFAALMAADSAVRASSIAFAARRFEVLSFGASGPEAASSDSATNCFLLHSCDGSAIISFKQGIDSTFVASMCTAVGEGTDSSV